MTPPGLDAWSGRTMVSLFPIERSRSPLRGLVLRSCIVDSALAIGPPIARPWGSLDFPLRIGLNQLGKVGLTPNFAVGPDAGIRRGSGRVRRACSAGCEKERG